MAGSTTVRSSQRATSGWLRQARSRSRSSSVGGRRTSRSVWRGQPSSEEVMDPAYPLGATRLHLISRCGTLARHEHQRVATTRPHRLRRRSAQGRAARPPRGVGVTADRRRARERHPGSSVPERPRGAGPLLHLHRLRPLHRPLPRDGRPAAHPGGRADAHLRGGPRPRGPAGALRRADDDAVHLRRARHPHRGLHRGRSRTPAPPPSATTASSSGGSTTSPASPGSRRPTRPCRTPSTTGRTRSSGSASAAPRSVSPAPSSRRTSRRPAPPGCTRCRTPASRPGRSRCGTP